MITEFIGLPGSGKSTLAHRFAEHHGGRVLKVNGFSYGSSVGRVAPALSQPSLMALASRMDRRLAINLCRRNRIMSGLSDCDLWIEDGPLFALTRMVKDKSSDNLVTAVVRRLRLPDRCVIVRASPSTCLYRLTHLRNGNNRVVRLEPSEAMLVLDHLARAIDRVVTCLPDRVEVLRLDNDEESPSPAQV